MLAKALASATAAAPRTYVEDVFSTWLYTGNGSAQTITNGIDLSGEGGLVWYKSRNNAVDNALFDTARGAGKLLISNSTSAEGTGYAQSFTSSGFSLNNGGTFYNGNGYTYASWTFRKAAKFFDVVTFTVSGSNTNLRVSHSLGSVPGCWFIKRTDASGAWVGYHRSLGVDAYVILNQTSSQITGSNWWGTAPTSTDFGINEVNLLGASGTYVAYLFAHDAGGFGDSGNDSVVKCGSYAGTGPGNTQNISLGWEPQFLLIKRTDSSNDWLMFDNMRGIVSSGSDPTLLANTTAAENASYGSLNMVDLHSSGFTANNANYTNISGATYIYIAIRRGPMKTPTDATKVFEPVSATLSSGSPTISTASVVVNDALFTADRNMAGAYRTWQARLTGGNWLNSASTGAETSGTYTVWDLMSRTKPYNYNDGTQITYNFRRAPGFFDVVAYAGGGFINESISHNLGVKPELVIIKRRNASELWWVNAVFGASTFQQGSLNTTDQFTATTYSAQGFGNPTSSALVFNSIGSSGHASGGTYIAYLFATCSGISKVGSYTGTGTTQQINCGFTAGARFVLIKRTDSTGDWYVWDTARGIISGNDPYLLLNSTAAEVTNTDYIDPLNSGFEISSTAPAAINANGGSYIYLAIA